MPPTDPDTMPGHRAALPAGSLPTTYLAPQGDENREPPVNAPASVMPAPVVEWSRPLPPTTTRHAQVTMHRVARLAELTGDSITRTKLAGDTEIILVRSGDDIRAFGANCPHAGAPLEGGAVCHGRLICPWHKAQFRIDDGALLEPPALDDLIRYPVHLEGDDVLVAERPVAVPAPAKIEGETIAVIGSGAGGTAAVAELRRLGFDGRLLLIGAEAQCPYDRTSLSKFVMSGDMEADDAPALREPAWFARNRVERIEVAVTCLDAAAKTVHLGDGRIIPYGKALVALGAAAGRPSLPGMALRGAYTLRSKADASAIVAAAAKGAHAVIMGASFIGLEAASALRKKGVQVTVVAPDPVPFGKQFGAEIGGMFRRLHEANGVAFRLESEVVSIRGTHAVDRVALKGGAVLPADLVVIGVGVAPATDIVQGVERADDGGIVVDASFRAADGLYAAGDCATFPWHGKKLRIEHWRVAQQHAFIAAAAMLGGSDAYTGVPFFWTYHYGKRFEYLGHASEWDRLFIDGDPDSQTFVALQIKDEQVAGVIACQRERITAVLIDRLREPLPVAEAVALIRSA
jgi:NADPH-dependent 2,4-dienoyl-CoA reductase/sulfur reductase-like enzyme/nitrite reductase/ring-hydroxylating ferredoxin subunit